MLPGFSLGDRLVESEKANHDAMICLATARGRASDPSRPPTIIPSKRRKTKRVARPGAPNATATCMISRPSPARSKDKDQRTRRQKPGRQNLPGLQGRAGPRWSWSVADRNRALGARRRPPDWGRWHLVIPSDPIRSIAWHPRTDPAATATDRRTGSAPRFWRGSSNELAHR
jgi:hypothetical protein